MNYYSITLSVAAQHGSGDRDAEPFENLAIWSFPLSIGV
jgi:hypothetical protein